MRFFRARLIRWAICLLCGAFAVSSHNSAFAQAGNALSFDGQDDCVFVPYDPSFPVAIFSVGAWIKTPPPMGNGAIIGRGEDDDSFNFAWQLYLNGAGNFQLTLENAMEQNFCYPLTCMGGMPVGTCTFGDMFVADDEWHHVAATRNAAGDLSMYIDGVEVASCTNTGVPSVNNSQFLTIGCTHFFIGFPPGGEEPTDWFFPGDIDEPAMWNVALTSSQMMDVFLNGIDPSSGGLVGYWNFDEGEGQQVADLSPASNDGFRGEQETPDVADPEWISVGPLPDPTPEFRRGDVNDSGGVELADMVGLLSHLFLNGPEPGCLNAADVNGDLTLGLVDVVYGLNFLFLNGAAPPPPGPECGEDAVPGALSCETYESC